MRICSPLRKRALKLRSLFRAVCAKDLRFADGAAGTALDTGGVLGGPRQQRRFQSRSRTSISRTPRRPQKLAGSPASETQPVLTDAQGIAYSRASAGVFREFVMCACVHPETPFLLGRAPMAPAMVS